MTILSVQAIGSNTFRVAFSDVVTYDGSSLFSNLLIDGDAVASCSAGAGPVSTVDCSFGVADGGGLPWSLSATPPEFAEAFDIPEAGTTT